MKKILLFSIISLLIFGCCANWTPPDFWNVEISPTRVKRGDEITVTYDTRLSEKDFIEELYIDKDGNLLISEDYKNRYDERKFEDNYNNFIRFNTKFRDDATPSKKNVAEDCNSLDYECGKEKIAVTAVSEDYELSDVYPAKYISCEFGKIVCTVPDNAVSGILFLDCGNATGFSAEKLIIIDENGKEITE